MYEIFIYSGIINLIVVILFSWSLYNCLKLINKSNQRFPAWFCWLLIIPIVNYIFAWLMIPFGIPHSLITQFEQNPTALKKAKNLYTIGLIFMLLTLGFFIPYLSAIVAIPCFIFLIIYWVKVVAFKNQFLVSKVSIGPQVAPNHDPDKK